uniref:Uncharacterized protein n=1 Tax=Eptatretus burgeri TaxID=7764 RepID=A0A8C4Q8Y1_EPTBU
MEQLQIITVSKRHLAEIEGNTMRLYGTGALEVLERNLSMHSSISAISFHYIHFDDIMPVFSKITKKLPSVTHLEFAATNLHCLQQLNALARLQFLEQLTISSANPIVSLSLWRSYAIFHLQPLGLLYINEKQFFSKISHILVTVFHGTSTHCVGVCKCDHRRPGTKLFRIIHTVMIHFELFITCTLFSMKG